MCCYTDEIMHYIYTRTCAHTHTDMYTHTCIETHTFSNSTMGLHLLCFFGCLGAVYVSDAFPPASMALLVPNMEARVELQGETAPLRLW